jgi:hypothetical protein
MSKVPSDVARWLKLAERSKHNPDDPRVLPIVKIKQKWYFVDERLHELRNVQNPDDTKRFRDQNDLQEYRYWTEQLQEIVGSRVVSAEMQYDESFDQFAPVLVLSNGKAIMMVSDEEGNNAGRFEYLSEK